MSSIEQRELERLRYRQGQLLGSRDLNDQTEIENQLRWWHNRALHNTFGIASGVLDGFEVQLTDESAREFTVKPGVAYDCFGRELILTRERKEKIPAYIVEGGAVLFAQYRRQSTRTNSTGQCLGPNESGLVVELKWTTETIDVRDGVTLAQIDDVEKLNSETDISPATPIVRPIARPHIASGATSPDGTGWELWTQKTTNGEFFLGFQVDVDTSAAGFVRIPCYFAWTPNLIMDLTDLSAAEVTGFTYRTWSPILAGVRLDNNPFLVLVLQILLKRVATQVCWIGLEEKSQSKGPAG